MSFDPADFPAPTVQDEAWRFTPLRRVRKLLSPLAQPDGSTLSVVGPDWVTSSATPTGPVVPGAYLEPTDLPSALAWSLAPRINLVTVPAGTRVAEPIRVTVTGHGDSYETIRVTAEADSKAAVVLDHRGAGDHVTNVEVEAGPRSDLTVASVQDWEPRSLHLGRIHTHVGRDASVRQAIVTLGGSLVRLVSTVTFDGPGGQVELLGAYHADARQHLEHRLFIDHSVPRCRSSVAYRGVLQGEGAHTVWVGDVVIRPGAPGTDTYEINRNLVLSAGARANSIPNLEIETGDVARAGHASATGRLDDEQLFYLSARGIARAQARSLVVRGFLAEPIEAIGDATVRDHVWNVIGDRLAQLEREPDR